MNQSLMLTEALRLLSDPKAIAAIQSATAPLVEKLQQSKANLQSGKDPLTSLFDLLNGAEKPEETAPVVEELNERDLAAKVLGVSVHASNDEIKKAHRIKIRDFHSDRNVGVTDAVREILEQKAAEINHARDVLLKL